MDRGPGAENPLKIHPIGFFRCAQSYPQQAPRQGSLADPELTGTVVLHKNRGFEQSLADLSGFERIWLIYWFDRNTNWKPMVMPPRGGKKRGVFATRSPHRPNPLGLSCVRLLKVEGLTLTVSGFDLLDGTPIMDIKPYLPYADSFPDSAAGWTDEARQVYYKITYSQEVNLQLDFIMRQTGYDLKAFLETQLSSTPADPARKRIKAADPDAGLYVIAARTWRVSYAVNNNDHTVLVAAVNSGYTDKDLSSPDDPYGDKAAHRAFREHFRNGPDTKKGPLPD